MKTSLSITLALLLHLFLLLAPGQSFAITQAQPKVYSFQFNEILLPDLLKLVYSDVLDRSYVLDTDPLKNEDALTVHIRSKTAQEVEAYILALLDSRGFAVAHRGTVDVIGKKPESTEPNKEIFVYRPRFRSVSYLQDILQALFPRGAFSGQRQISNNYGSTNDQHIQQSQPANSTNKQQQQPAQNTVPDTGTSSFSQIDKNTQDTLVFQGEIRDVQKLTNLLVQLDTPGAELVVKAVVYEVRTDHNEGSALTLAASIISGKLGIAIDGGATPGNSIKLKFGNLAAVYSALAGDKRFKLVSSPTMRVKSGATARFVAGSEVPVLGAVTYQEQGGQPIQNVEYKSSGVILDLKPQVREDVTDLTIFQQISSFIPTTTGVNQSPTLLKRELQTQVTAKDDEMIVLGGLEESQDTGSEQGLSFLPKFMRASSDESTKTEIMVFLNLQRI